MQCRASYTSLANCHVMITGGATGIGAAMVEAFYLQGSKVSFIDIDFLSAECLVDKLRSVQAESTNSVPQSSKKYVPHFIRADVTQFSQLNDAVSEAIEYCGPVSVLVNNVANDQRQEFTQTTPQSWRDCMSVNLDPVFFMSQLVYGSMQSLGGGSIINFSSINALLGPAKMAGYVAAKSAILGLTKSLAQEMGEHNIRVNAILPGWVVTEKQLDQWLTPQAEKEWMQQVCLKKRILPINVAELALFLASESASMITAQHFVIDGGRV